MSTMKKSTTITVTPAARAKALRRALRDDSKVKVRLPVANTQQSDKPVRAAS